jgi:hypothetical protein
MDLTSLYRGSLLLSITVQSEKRDNPIQMEQKAEVSIIHEISL